MNIFLKMFLIISSFICISIQALAGEVRNGGDTLPDDQVPAEKIIDFLSHARRNAYSYLSYENRKKNPDFAQLFSAKPSIFEIILKTKIDIKTDRPCKDETGQDSDGSSVSDMADSICISVPRLQSKLIEDNLYYQTLALVVHEYSHRVGFNEQQADQLQKFSVQTLRREMDHVITDADYNFYVTEMERLHKDLQKVIKWYDTIDTKYLLDGVFHPISGEFERKQICDTTRCIDDPGNYKTSSVFRFLNLTDYSRLVAQATVAHSIPEGVCALGYHCSFPEQKSWYEAAFHNQTTISTFDFLNSVGHDHYYQYDHQPHEDSILSSVRFNRLTRQTLRQETLNQLKAMEPVIGSILMTLKAVQSLKD